MNKQSPLLTIAMPVYNGGKDLPVAVQSILNQSFSDWELLLIDDGSSDKTVEYIQALADPRIKTFVDAKNKGLAVRLNQAVDLANGTFFARMDHDDICHPDRFEKQISYLVKNPEVDLLATQCITVDENNQIVGTLPSAKTHREICKSPWLGFYMVHPSWMGKIAWFKQHRYDIPAHYFCEDQELLLRTYKESTFHTLDQHLLAYRIQNGLKLNKRIRTRLAVLKMQIAHFSRNHEYIFLMLSCIAFVMRVCRDFTAKVFSMAASPTRANPISSQSALWQHTINKIVKQSDVKAIK